MPHRRTRPRMAGTMLASPPAVKRKPAAIGRDARSRPDRRRQFATTCPRCALPASIALAAGFQEHWRDEPRSLNATTATTGRNCLGRVKMRPKPIRELELRPVAAPTQDHPGAYVYVLLPT